MSWLSRIFSSSAAHSEPIIVPVPTLGHSPEEKLALQVKELQHILRSSHVQGNEQLSHYAQLETVAINGLKSIHRANLTPSYVNHTVIRALESYIKGLSAEEQQALPNTPGEYVWINAEKVTDHLKLILEEEKKDYNAAMSRRPAHPVPPSSDSKLSH
jgi:hypothetical protein